MKIRLLHKVFFALFVTAGVALAVMALLVQWSLGRGFLDYVNAIEQERVDTLSETLGAQYVAHGRNWEFVRNQGAWRRLTRPGGNSERGNRRPRPRGPEQGRKSENRLGVDSRRPIGTNSDRDRPNGPREDQGRPNGRRTNPGGPAGPPRRPPPGGQLLDPGPRISLFDSEQRKVIGRAKEVDAGHYQKSIVLDGRTVGWLTLMPLRRVSESRDLNFLQQQSRALIFIAIGLLLGAALLAVFFARQLTRPLRAMTDVVRHLAGGQYQHRVSVAGTDELAMLSRDVNTLAGALDDNQRARQRWIADISHELRTPLAIIQGEVEALKDGVRPMNEHTISSIHTEVRQLGKLVDDLHELSLSDIGALTYQMAPVSVADLVGGVVELFTPRMIDSHLKLIYQNLCKDPTLTTLINGDHQRLTQLFTNLLENSLRYTDPGVNSQVSVEISQHENQVKVVIADSAPGVNESDYDRMFERLYRVDTSRNRAKGGSGLGLSICNSIVEAHNGTIRATSSKLGGIEITINFPLLVNHR